MLFGIVLLAGAVIRFHNAFAANPLWGYDGGAHLAYLEIVRVFHRLPTPAETYLAWHEPLYYILASAATGAGLRVLQAILGVAFIAAAGWCGLVITRRADVAVFIGIIAAFLPPAVLLSNYPTNELLAQTLFLAGLIMAIRILREKTISARLAATLGTILALAQWTKLSAIIVVAAVAIAFIGQRRWRALAISLGIWLVLMIPWQVYRATRLGGVFRTNNVEQPGTTLHPLRFYLWFDPAVLDAPYWPHGSSSAWSLIFAQTFADYDVQLGNPDRAALLPARETVLTGSGRYLPLVRLAAGIALSRLGLALVAISALGFVSLMRRARQEPVARILAVYVFLSLAAVIYHGSRYPYLDRGTLKPIFILAALLLPLIAGCDVLLRRYGRAATLGLWGLVILFAVLAAPVVWVR